VTELLNSTKYKEWYWKVSKEHTERSKVHRLWTEEEQGQAKKESQLLEAARVEDTEKVPIRKI